MLHPDIKERVYPAVDSNVLPIFKRQRHDVVVPSSAVLVAVIESFHAAGVLFLHILNKAVLIFGRGNALAYNVYSQQFRIFLVAQKGSEA